MTRLRLLLPLLCTATLCAQTPANRPDRLEWFRDQGFGLFIHWSVDSQLGTVISHSLAGASDDYTRRFFTELPKTFNPRKFHPEDWAALAKLAGVKYVVFTAKHHSGFAMWQTATTNFGILQTPYHERHFRQNVRAFQEQGIAPGVYLSPDDFRWLYENNITINRGPAFDPPKHPGLLALDQAQLQELLTKYGPIDMVFLRWRGGRAARGGVAGSPGNDSDARRHDHAGTVCAGDPARRAPGKPISRWGRRGSISRATRVYKSGSDLIRLLYETRAKGGNLLLNVGPKPDGELPIEQEERLREIALWMFVNQEAIYAVRPWVITNEQRHLVH